MNTQPTPYADLNAVLRELVTRVQSVLDGKLVGAYLQGSFAVGDFDRFSDVDFLIVLEEDISDVELPILQALHGDIFEMGSSWARHLEGSYIPKAAFKTFPPPQRKFWYLDNGSKELVRSDHDDVLVVYWVLREKGIALIGPEPAELVPAVPVEAMREEILATMHTWQRHFLANPTELNNRFYQPFAVVSYCRMLHALQIGRVESKLAGATWAKDALDSRWRDLIQQALDDRPGYAETKVRQAADAAALVRTWEFIQYAADLGQEWKRGGRF